MYTRFQVRHYKNLDTPELELGRINLLVGPNNSGKSNFLSALSVMRDIQAAPLVNVVQARGGPDFRRRGAHASVRFRWSCPGPTTYVVEVDPGQRPDGRDVRRLLEVLSEEPVEPPSDQAKRTSAWIGRGNQIHGVNNVPDTLLSGRPSISDGEADTWYTDAHPRLVRMVRRHRDFRMAWFEPGAIAEPSSAKEPDDELAPNGANLPRVLRRWEQESVKGLEPLRDWMRAAIPGLDRIWVKDSSGSHFWIQLGIDGESWTLADMSDGTVRLLVLASLLFRPDTHTVLTIDEPELNLHPAWQREVARWFQTSQAFEQLFVSTHSPDLLDGFTDAFRAGEVKLFVFNTEPGRPSVDPVPPERLDALFEEGWRLGDVYRVGDTRLGGWP